MLNVSFRTPRSQIIVIDNIEHLLTLTNLASTHINHSPNSHTENTITLSHLQVINGPLHARLLLRLHFFMQCVHHALVARLQRLLKGLKCSGNVHAV